MSAVDAPPGLVFAGLSHGEFRARRRPRLLARWVFVVVCLLGGTTLSIASRKLWHPAIELLFVGPLVAMSIAGVGLAVRTARIHVEQAGVRWGWGGLGFRITRERLAGVDLYRDAVALRPARGSSWFLSARDWDGFDRFAAAFSRADIELREHDRRAPLAARLQSYGRVLDGLVILALLGSLGLVALAIV